MNFGKFILNSKKGQTVIETVFMLLILLVIFFMIAEFARAWYLKNSLNNAARVGARVAVVGPNLVDASNTCSAAMVNPSDPIYAACSASGVPGDTVVALAVDDANSDGRASQGEKVTISLTAGFVTVAPRLLPFMPDSIVAEASMRHE